MVVGITAIIGIISQSIAAVRWAASGLNAIIIEFGLRSKYAALEVAMANVVLTEDDINLINKRVEDHVKKTKKVEEGKTPEG